MEECFSSFACVVDELKKREVVRQLFLRDTTMWPEPGSQQRPKSFHRIDVNFAKSISIVVTCILLVAMVHWTFASIRITTSPDLWIIPNMGGFSFSSVPRPRSPFKRRRRPSRPFFDCLWIALRRSAGSIIPNVDWDLFPGSDHFGHGNDHFQLESQLRF